VNPARRIALAARAVEFGRDTYVCDPAMAKGRRAALWGALQRLRQLSEQTPWPTMFDAVLRWMERIDQANKGSAINDGTVELWLMAGERRRFGRVG
jgi:ActR/RegA family two-component response regulator